MGYVDYARFLSGASNGTFYHYRPPGFSLFLIATGLIRFDSFTGPVFVYAAMGILAPWLVYRTLEPLSRLAATVTATAFIASSIPFSYTKLMLSDHLFMFLVLLMVYWFSRAYFFRSGLATFGALLAGTAAALTRSEGLPLFLATVAFLALGLRRRRNFLVLALAVIVALLPLVAWSALRSSYAGQPVLFGSLNNFSGRQLLWRVYVSLPTEVLWWQRKVLHAPSQHLTADGSGVVLVDPQNGPATRRLYRLLVEIASEKPSRFHYMKEALASSVGAPPGGFYAHLFEPFDGNPEDLATNVFAHPSQFYNDWMRGEVERKLGIVKADRLSRRVAWEAVAQHPVILGAVVSSSTWYFGIAFDQLLNGRMPPFAPIVTDAYERVPFNLANCAVRLTRSLMAEYRRDHRRGIPTMINRIVDAAQILHYTIRNVCGILFLFTVWVLPWSRRRAIGLFVATLALLSIGAGSVGFGWNGRYEHWILPLMMMAVASSIVATDGLLRLWPQGRRPSEKKADRESSIEAE